MSPYDGRLVPRRRGVLPGGLARHTRQRGLRLLLPSLMGLLVVAACPGRARAQQGSAYVLAGKTPTSGIGVDDDLVVSLNGSPLYQDRNGVSTLTPPIRFIARPGDKLRVIAVNGAGCEWLDPLHLYQLNPTTGAVISQWLLSNGVPPDGRCNYPSGPFFDQTYEFVSPASSGSPARYTVFAKQQIVGAVGSDPVSRLLTVTAPADSLGYTSPLQGPVHIIYWGVKNDAGIPTRITEAAVWQQDPRQGVHLFFDAQQRPVRLRQDSTGVSILLSYDSLTQTTMTLVDASGNAVARTIATVDPSHVTYRPVPVSGPAGVAAAHSVSPGGSGAHVASIDDDDNPPDGDDDDTVTDSSDSISSGAYVDQQFAGLIASLQTSIADIRAHAPVVGAVFTAAGVIAMFTSAGAALPIALIGSGVAILTQATPVYYQIQQIIGEPPSVLDSATDISRDNSGSSYPPYQSP